MTNIQLAISIVKAAIKDVYIKENKIDMFQKGYDKLDKDIDRKAQNAIDRMTRMTVIMLARRIVSNDEPIRQRSAESYRVCKSRRAAP